MDTEAEEESTINRELAHVMCARLDAARRATERLLGVLQARQTDAIWLALSVAAFVPAVADPATDLLHAGHVALIMCM